MPRAHTLSAVSQEAQTVAIETIFPIDAQQYLALMRTNRKVRQRHLEHLTAEVQSGQWQLNGETIKFDEEGHLIDGQHRLLAILHADTAIQTYVVRHLPAQAHATIDLGLKRSPGDILGLEGYSNATNLCASARWLWRYETGQMTGYRVNPSIETLKATLSAHPDLKNSLSYGSLLGRYITRSLGSALHCLGNEQDPVLTETLVQAIYTGEGLLRTNPLYLLRQRLIANSQAKAKLPDYEVAALTIKAFNACRASEAIRTLRWRTSGEKPELFPTFI